MEEILCDGCDIMCEKKKTFQIRVIAWPQSETEMDLSFSIIKHLCPKCYEDFLQQVQSYFKWQGNKQEGM